VHLNDVHLNDVHLNDPVLMNYLRRSSHA